LGRPQIQITHHPSTITHPHLLLEQRMFQRKAAAAALTVPLTRFKPDFLHAISCVAVSDSVSVS
jgi:hypothetical protein